MNNKQLNKDFRLHKIIPHFGVVNLFRHNFQRILLNTCQLSIEQKRNKMPNQTDNFLNLKQCLFIVNKQTFLFLSKFFIRVARNYCKNILWFCYVIRIRN